MNKSKDFLRKIVDTDLKSGKYTQIITRFPPEPNGFPHIGHAKSISINFGIAKDYDGYCTLRMDDTNPSKEDTAYVKALQDAVTWLGFEYKDNIRYTSDYFDKIYNWAIELIKMQKAYVDSLSEDEIKEYRGTVTSPGKRSKYANRTIKENLDLFEKMKNGEFEDGVHVLRAKIDMGASNMKLRDPLLYRIRNVEHFRTSNKWSIYPMYDFAHCLSDYIEGITHSICTLEFENNRDIYNWVLETLKLEKPRPYQHEFARLGINYTVMSKRKLLELVQNNIVSGWDDPRLPTIAGYKRKGYTPESILNFCDQIGIAKANSTVDVSQLEFCIRDDLNKKVPRVMCIVNPLKVSIINYDGVENIEASYYPKDVPKVGSRILPFSKDIYIDKNDFEENPQKGYFRLTPNQSVRLKYAYIITLKEVIKDDNGDIVELKVTYHKDSKSGQDTSGIKVKSAIQWVESKSAKQVELRLYDRLFKNEMPNGIEDINENSLKIVKDALIEPAVINDKIDVRFQFEREGYFYCDPIDYTDAKPVFNKIVSLKDSWNKKEVKPKTKQNKEIKKVQINGKITPLNDKEQILFDKYTKQLKLNNEIANIIARDEQLSSFYEQCLALGANEINLANIVSNEVAKVLKDKNINDLKFSALQINELVKAIDEEIISSKIAKEVFNIMSKTSKDPMQIIKDKNLMQISNPDEIKSMINEVIINNSDNVKKYKDGNNKLFGFFVGQVLKASNGKANPKLVNELVLEQLNK